MIKVEKGDSKIISLQSFYSKLFLPLASPANKRIVNFCNLFYAFNVFHHFVWMMWKKKNIFKSVVIF